MDRRDRSRSPVERRPAAGGAIRFDRNREDRALREGRRAPAASEERPAGSTQQDRPSSNAGYAHAQGGPQGGTPRVNMPPSTSSRQGPHGVVSSSAGGPSIAGGSRGSTSALPPSGFVMDAVPSFFGGAPRAHRTVPPQSGHVGHQSRPSSGGGGPDRARNDLLPRPSSHGQQGLVPSGRSQQVVQAATAPPPVGHGQQGHSSRGHQGGQVPRAHSSASHGHQQGPSSSAPRQGGHAGMVPPSTTSHAQQRLSSRGATGGHAAMAPPIPHSQQDRTSSSARSSSRQNAVPPHQSSHGRQGGLPSDGRQQHRSAMAPLSASHGHQGPTSSAPHQGAHAGMVPPSTTSHAQQDLSSRRAPEGHATMVPPIPRGQHDRTSSSARSSSFQNAVPPHQTSHSRQGAVPSDGSCQQHRPAMASMSAGRGQQVLPTSTPSTSRESRRDVPAMPPRSGHSQHTPSSGSSSQQGGSTGRDGSTNRQGPPTTHRNSSMMALAGYGERDSRQDLRPERDSRQDTRHERDSCQDDRSGRDRSHERHPGRDFSQDRRDRDVGQDRFERDASQDRRGSWGGRGGSRFDRGPSRGRGGNSSGRGGNSFGRGGGHSGQAFAPEPPRDICDDAPSKQVNQRGTLGRKLQLKANFIGLKSDIQSLHVFHVDFDPPVESPRRKNFLVMSLKDVHQGHFIPHALLISKVDFTASSSGDLELSSKMRTGRGEDDFANVQIRFRKTTEVHLEKSTEFLTVLNNLSRIGMKMLNLVKIKHDFYDMKSKTNIEGYLGMVRVPSWDIPIKLHHGGLMMNVKIREQVIRTDTVLDHIKKTWRQYPQDYQAHAKASLIGQVVRLKYSGTTFKIGDILWNLNVHSPYRTDSEETVLQYYKRQYPEEPDAKITDLMQPLIFAEPTAKDRRREAMAKRAENNGQVIAPKMLHLVPELCVMTGLVDEMKNSDAVRRDLAAKLRKNPDQRVADIWKFVSRYTSENVQKLLKDYHLHLEQEMVSVEARQLSDISLTIKGRKVAIHRASFNHCLKRQAAERPGAIKSWAVVVSNQDASGCHTWVRQAMQVFQDLSPIPEPKICPVDGRQSKDFMKKIGEILDDQLDFVLVVVPDGEEARYAAIKKFLNCDHGIPCQVVLAQNIKKDNMSITTKICAQIVAKTGGALWSCPTSKSGTMIVGFDLYKPKAVKGRSVSAMVASLDDNMTTYTSVSFIQPGDQFVSQNFGEAFRRCLNVYRKRNGPPKRIVIYRGGVSFGEQDTLKAMEISPIQDNLRQSGCKETQIAYIVVTKSANVHFFAQQQGGNRFTNPPDGVVIDNTITSREGNDFYLIPQSANQGCVSPVYYQILEDGIREFSADYYQLLTFKLTHTYYNWTGAIKVPGVLQYATKLGTLVGSYTSLPLHEKLSERLAFL